MEEPKTQAPEEKKDTKKGNDERLQLLKSRLVVAKKWSKKPHEAWRTWIAEYEIDNFDDTSEVRDKVRIGYIFRKTETEIPSIFDDQPDLFIKGKTNDFKDVEDIYNSAYDYLWNKQNLEEKIEDAGVYFELLGMGFISSPWLTKTKKVQEMVQQPMMDEAGMPVLDEMGQPIMQDVPTEYEVPTYDMPDATVEDPFKLYFSPETRFNYTMNSENCPYYFKEQTWVKEKVKAIFGKDVDAGDKLYTNESDVDIEITSEMEKSPDVKDDLKRVAVYEYYGTLPEAMAKDLGEWSYDKEYHIYFTKNEELQAEECPYSRYPLHIVGNYGLANKFWKFGDAKHLMPLVQELQIYRTQILQHTRKMANPKPLIEMNSEVDEQTFNDPRVGKPVKYAGTAPTYLSPANLGSEVATGVEMVRTDLEKTGPSFDLAGGGGQSEIRSPRGIATYSEAADKGSRRKRKKIARLIRQLIIFQFEQLGLNWKPEDGKTLEIGGNVEPVTPEILQVLSDLELLQKVDVEVESLSVNRVQMREDARELWDIAVSAPNIYNIQEIARDLLQNGYNKRDADRYLISMDQQGQQAVQAFIEQIAQSNPELAAQIQSIAQQPNAAQLQEGQDPAMTQPEQPSFQETVSQQAGGDLPPLPQV